MYNNDQDLRVLSQQRQQQWELLISEASQTTAHQSNTIRWYTRLMSKWSRKKEGIPDPSSCIRNPESTF